MIFSELTRPVPCVRPALGLCQTITDISPQNTGRYRQDQKISIASSRLISFSLNHRWQCPHCDLRFAYKQKLDEHGIQVRLVYYLLILSPPCLPCPLFCDYLTTMSPIVYLVSYLPRLLSFVYNAMSPIFCLQCLLFILLLPCLLSCVYL